MFSVKIRAENVSSKWREYRHFFTRLNRIRLVFPYKANTHPGSGIIQCSVDPSHH